MTETLETPTGTPLRGCEASPDLHPTHWAFWANRTLLFGEHAAKRVEERGVPVLSTLPERGTVKIAADKGPDLAYRLYVKIDRQTYCYVARPNGHVLTVFVPNVYMPGAAMGDPHSAHRQRRALARYLVKQNNKRTKTIH